MKMLESLETAKEKVEFILSNYPTLRDSDKKLWLGYLNLYHGLRKKIGEESYSILKEIILSDSTPTMESIRRIRQKLQENGLYQGEKRIQRLKEAEKVRRWAKK